MGNITKLSQGNLDGIKRQMCECLENAFNKGFEHGRNVIPSEAAEETKKIYNDGYEQGFKDSQLKAKLDIEEIKNRYEAQADRSRTEGYEKALSDIQEICSLNKEEYQDFLDFTGFMPKGSYVGLSLLLRINGINVSCKYHDWLKAKSVNVGDVVRFNRKCHRYEEIKDRNYLVLNVDADGVTLLDDDGDTSYAALNLLYKTGKHLCEAENLIEELAGSEEK